MSVTDETWSRLDPEAGAVPPHVRRRVTRGAAAVAGVAVLGTALWASGLVAPRLTEGSGSGWGASPRTVQLSATVRNAGLTGTDVVGVGRSLPGLELVGATPVPFRLDGLAERQVDVTYRVTDCAATGALVVPVRADTWWGTATTDLDLPQDSGTSLRELVRRACADG